MNNYYKRDIQEVLLISDFLYNEELLEPLESKIDIEKRSAIVYVEKEKLSKRCLDYIRIKLKNSCQILNNITTKHSFISNYSNLRLIFKSIEETQSLLLVSYEDIDENYKNLLDTIREQKTSFLLLSSNF